MRSIIAQRNTSRLRPEAQKPSPLFCVSRLFLRLPTSSRNGVDNNQHKTNSRGFWGGNRALAEATSHSQNDSSTSDADSPPIHSNCRPHRLTPTAAVVVAITSTARNTSDHNNTQGASNPHTHCYNVASMHRQTLRVNSWPRSDAFCCAVYKR